MMDAITEVSRQAFFNMSRVKTVILLAAPILVTMLSQNLMGLIDIAMIGQFGDSAQAAIGIGATIFFLLMSLVMGVSAGVQTIVARRIGEGKSDKVAFLLNAGICLAVGITIIMVILGYLLLPLVFSIVNKDPDVVRQGGNYLRTLLPCGIFLGMSGAFAGYWAGVSRPQYNLYSIFIQLIFNIVFNYVLIFGKLGLPQMGIAGAGLGTTLASCIAIIVQFFFAFKFARSKGFLKALPAKSEIKTLYRLIIPTSVQQFFFSLGSMVFLFIVGLIGTQQLAVFTVIFNFVNILMLLAMGLGISATTFVGGAMGRRDFADAKQWGWEIALLGAMILLTIGWIGTIIPDTILRLFIADPSTIAIGIIPLRIILIGIWIECVGRVLALSLIGAGAAATVFKIKFANQWLLRLPLFWLVGVHLEYGLVGIFLTTLVMYLLQTGIYIKIWQDAKWADIVL